ncbi:MAG: ABC transporter permease, partial [Candidatus Bathyarchaeia archaeon]
MEFLKLIRSNIKARSFRVFAIVVSTAVLMGLVFGGTIFNSGIDQSVRIGSDRLGADLIATHRQEDPRVRLLHLTVPLEEVIVVAPSDPRYMDPSVEDGVAAVDGVVAVAPQLYVGDLRYSTANVDLDFPVVAVDPDKDFSVKPWLNSTESLADALDHSGAVVGASTPFEVGDELTFKGSTFEIRDKLAESRIGLDNLVVVSLASAPELLSGKESKPAGAARYSPGQISALLIRIDPSRDVQEIGPNIESKVVGIRLAGRPEATVAIRAGLSGLQTYVTIMGASMWIMTAVLVSALFSMTVNERRKEIGVLRALGATKTYISVLILIEVIILVVIGS